MSTPWGPSGPEDPRRPLPPGFDPRRGLPPELDPRRGAPARPAGPPRRTRGQLAALVAKGIAGALSVTVLLASGVLWYLYRDFTGKVGRVNAIGSSSVDDVDGNDQNILLVGSDDRSTASAAELRELGTEMDPAKNTDTMILVHVPADGRQATAVSFPRDSYVQIPGVGKRKLNAAYANGAFGDGAPNPDRGRQLLVRTLSELSGLRIDHYVEVDLLGFYRITKAIGGVEVCLKAPQREKDSGIDLPAGRQTIEGKQALAFVRQRKGLPRGDLDRITRQQYFLSATFRKMTSAGVIGNPIKLKNLLDAVGTSLRMDEGLDPLQLARQVRGLAAGDITFTTVPNKGTANVDGASVVLLDEPALPAFFRSFVSGSSKRAPSKPRTVPRGEVAVTVLNGTGRAGLAGQTGGQLRAAGFRVAGTGNADRTDATVIRYGPGKRAAATTLAAVVPGAATTEQADLGDTLQLVLGQDFAGLRTGGSGGDAGAASADGPAAPASSAPKRTAAETDCIN